MAQQQQSNRSRLLPILILYMGFFWIWTQFLAPKPQPTPEQAQSLLQQARDLEARGRWVAASVADQKKSLEQAVGRYEEFYNRNKSTPDGIQARFQQVNLYNYLGKLDGPKAGTHWYDQAEGKLKDMEKAFHGRTGSVELQFHQQEDPDAAPFTMAHLQDPAALAAKLREPADPVSTYLRGRLAPETRKLLDDPADPAAYEQGTGFPAAPVRAALLRELNAARKDPALYEPERFAGVALRRETRAAARPGLTGPQLEAANRALLEDAYPKELTAAPRVVHEKGDLGAISSDRLNYIRAARDEVNQHRLTYRVMDVLVRLTGKAPAYSYFLALALMVIVLKALTFPFQKKQYQYQRDMMRIQPLIKEMQEKMKGRPQEEIQRRMMQIYKENNVNLLAGCLPMLVMMVVLFPMFWIVRDYEYQFVNAHFLWIGSKFSEQAWWLADNLAQFDVPLFVIYLVSTVLYSLMQPKPADPQQAQSQKMMLYMMPAVFGVMMWIYQWSSAFMLYWLVLNLVSMYQSWSLNRQYGLTPATAGAPAAAVPAAPAAPASLEPMQGVHTKSKSSRNGRGRGKTGRVRPRGAGERDAR